MKMKRRAVFQAASRRVLDTCNPRLPQSGPKQIGWADSYPCGCAPADICEGNTRCAE